MRSNGSEEEKSSEGGESELKHRSDDGNDEDIVNINDEEAHPQENPKKNQSVQESVVNRPIKAAVGTVIEHIE